MAKNIEVTLTLDTKGYNKKLARAKQQTAGFGGTAKVTQGSVIGLAARFAPLAAAVVGVGAAFKGVSSAMSTAQGFQDVQVTLSNLIGSAEGGAAALAKIKDVAQELPFEFEELAKSAPALTTVSGTIGELEDNMKLAADLAANFGIPFEVAAGQLQRSFSAGAGAADVFREKGVLSAAGFEAGVTYSIDETQKKLEEFGKTIEGSANKLNQTLTGALSQTSDRFTTFQDSVGQAMLPEFQVFLQELVKLFDQNKEAITEFGTRIGDSIVAGFRILLQTGAVVVDYFTMLFGVIRDVVQFIQDKFGTVIGNVMGFAVRAIAGVIEAVSFLGAGIGKLISIATGNDDIQKFFENIQDAANKTRTGGIEMLKESLGDIASGSIQVTTAQDFVNNLLGNIDEAVTIIDEKNKEIQDKIAQTGDDTLVAISQSATKSLEDFAAGFGALSDGVLETLKTFESATKKLSDDLAQALIDGQGAGDAFKNYFKSLVKDIIAQAIRLAVIQPILSSIFGVQFGAGGSITGFSGGIFGKANGGPVSANKPYLVGERGPELFTPGSSGSITPNGEFGGGSTTIINNITAMDTQSVKQALAKQDPEFIFGLSQAGARRVPG
jgi:hypothetical protein